MRLRYAALGYVGLLVAFALLAGRTAKGDVGIDLPVEVEARVLKTAEAELGHIERALRLQPGIDAAAVANVTLPLQAVLEQDLGRGPVKLYPLAIYEACLIRLKKGEARDDVSRDLVDMHRRGDLAKHGGGAGAEPAAKRVASFVFDKERVKFPDPHLPPGFKPPIGEKTVKGVYLICVGADGKVSKVSTVLTIPGADHTVMEQIESTWLYKPQPVPVCTPRQFVFQFN
jgi:hypothetical protein